MGRVWLAAAAASVLLSSGPTYPPRGSSIGERYGDPSVLLPWLTPCGPASGYVSISLEAFMGDVYPERSWATDDMPLHYTYSLRIRPALNGPGGLFDCSKVVEVRYFVLSALYGFGEDTPLVFDVESTGSIGARIYNPGQVVQEARLVRGASEDWAELVVYVPRIWAGPDIRVHHQAVVFAFTANDLLCILTSNGLAVEWVLLPTPPT